MHIKSLDGLRGLAALWVVLAHYSGTAGLFPSAGDGGKTGVMVFFVLSGFLMGHLYFNQAPTRAAVGEFFRRRAARVLPLYFLVVFVSFGFMLTGQDYWPYHVTAGEQFLKHLFIINGRSALWTIPIEVHFYLLFPLFWLCRHKLGDKAVWVFAGLLALFFALPPLSMNWIYGCFHWFVAGLVIACLPMRSAPVWNVGFVASITAVILLCPAVAGLDDTADDMWRNPVSLLAISGLVLCTIRAPLAHAVLGWRPLVFLGTISYSLYLLHMPVLRVLWEFTDLEGWAFLAAYTPLTLAISYAGYRWIEGPARRFFSQGAVGQPTLVASRQI